jgi:hypothetical protein
MKIDLREIGLGAMDWIVSAWDRDKWRALVNTVYNSFGCTDIRNGAVQEFQFVKRCLKMAL